MTLSMCSVSSAYMVMSRSTDWAVSLSISILPMLAPMLETAASRRASVPTFCSLRTRMVRIILRSHAIGSSFRTYPRVHHPHDFLLLYNFEDGFQLIEGFDRRAVSFREDSLRIVENRPKSRAARTDNIGVV